ncbi:MurR/RpiR family transcriptional regulator [Clostridium sp. Marseille-P3244]|uniref:MurR/RpiR family transcriptional regulator n=1 Tax=Clostridium sp. Marseille-P3244 TaxID=1871020 RepID=UPI0009303486|nr:MurR/RpiR family transcriptional regulator [Clostridium sp. Marseille-P3244]
MAEADVFSKIRTLNNSFTKAEKKVAEYVLKYPREVLNTSISDLAEKCGVGDTSVFRFCKTLKFKGYQDFKMAVVRALSNSGSEENWSINSEINISDSLTDVTNKLLTTNISSLNETYSLLNIKHLEKAVDALIYARQILFLGVGSSLLSALEAYNRFLRITPKTKCPLDAHMQAMEASLLGSGDVAVIISFSGSTKDSVECARLAKEGGAFVIALTRYVKSPLTNYADVVLICGSNEGPLQGGSVTAQISLLYLLDMLYVEFFKRQYSLSAANKEKTSSAVTDKIY